MMATESMNAFSLHIPRSSKRGIMTIFPLTLRSTASSSTTRPAPNRVSLAWQNNQCIRVEPRDRLTPFFHRITNNHRLLRFSSSPSSGLPGASSPPSPSLSDDAIHLTDNFVKRMRELQASEGSAEEQMLRLGVEAGGCSGFQYVFDLDGKVNPDDRLFEKEGVKLVVDNVTYDFVRGATIDYEEELIRSAFVVSANPNSSSKCSCNSSFSVKQ